MAKSKKKKETTYLVCQETGDINYVLYRKPGAEKLQLKKYSPRLRRIVRVAPKPRMDPLDLSCAGLDRIDQPDP